MEEAEVEEEKGGRGILLLLAEGRRTWRKEEWGDIL